VSYLAKVVTSLLFLLFTTQSLSDSFHPTNFENTSSKTPPSGFHDAAIKYVPLFESQILNEASAINMNSRLERLAARYDNEGMTEELALDLLQLTNTINSHLATRIGLSVFDLPDFQRFFQLHINEYILPNSPVYEILQNNDISIMPVERIRVVCNGLHCNNPSSTILKGWIVLAFISNGIGATQSSDVRVVSDQGGEYSNTSGVWRNNGFANIELVSVRPCDNCKLN